MPHEAARHSDLPVHEDLNSTVILRFTSTLILVLKTHEMKTIKKKSVPTVHPIITLRHTQTIFKNELSKYFYKNEKTKDNFFNFKLNFFYKIIPS